MHPRLGLWVIIGALILALSRPAAAADEYWDYRLGDLTVTTVQGSARALGLAHNIARFDRALSKVLALSDAHLPTHIYELPPREQKALLGQEDLVAYRFDGYRVIVSTYATGSLTTRDWGALFGYTGSRVTNGRAVRSPLWYHSGVPQLFADAKFELRDVKTGDVSVGYLNTLLQEKLLPARVLLRIQPGDPQLKDSAFRRIFEAESWFLTREIYVEGKLRAEFTQYLTLMRDGKPEADAFAESFKISVRGPGPEARKLPS